MLEDLATKDVEQSLSRRDEICLLYTSDAADDLTRVDLGGRPTCAVKNLSTRRY